MTTENSIIKLFEENYSDMRLDKLSKGLWADGSVYQDRVVNKLYHSFLLGYTFGRIAPSIDISKTATVISSEDDFYHFCSECNNEVYKKDKYCHTCGRELKWRKNNVKL